MGDTLTTHFHTSWGWIKITYNKNAILSLTLPVPHRILSEKFDENTPFMKLSKEYSYIWRIESLLERYFSGEKVDFNIPVDLEHLPLFTRKVLKETSRIPYGEVRSYGWIAEKINHPHSSRAVGNAVGANPVPIIIPCHRVIRKNEAIGGFGGGIDMKKRLLRLEGLEFE